MSRRKKRKKALPPRHEQLSRPARLRAARRWLQELVGEMSGRTITRRYAKWFGVDLGCALKELGVLGVAVDPVYAEQIRATLRGRNRPRRRAAEPETDIPEGYGSEWDENYSFIAGFTSGGGPFGTRWDEDDEPPW